MGIAEVLRKFLGGNSPRNTDGTLHRGKTPDEVELESYEREEYLKNVKCRLQRYRNQKNHDALVGSNPLAMKGTMLQKHKYQLMR
jgi:hypothetical protein